MIDQSPIWTAIDFALNRAGDYSPEWNLRFLEGLSLRGYEIVPEEIAHRDGVEDFREVATAPIPHDGAGAWSYPSTIRKRTTTAR